MRQDFSQAKNVAADHPDKVQELRELWWKEAERNRVLPLMAGLSVLFGRSGLRAQKAPYAFTGTIKNVAFDRQPGAYDEQALHLHAAHNAVAQGVAG